MAYADSRHDNQDRRYNAWHRNVGLALAALVLLLPLFGIGPNTWRTCGGSAAVAASAESVAPTPEVTPQSPAAAPGDVVPSARVFFAVNETNAPSDVANLLGPVVAYLNAHPEAKAVLQGFHDPRGSRAKNEALALDRARTVRTELGRLGISRERIVMEKPAETAGSGSNDEARRVEVTVKP